MPEASLSTTIPSSLVAGIAARLVCHPLDTCKARIQASSSGNVYKNFLDVIRVAVRQDGGRSLYQGLAAATMGSAPAVCIYIGGFEFFRKFFMKSSLCTDYPALADFSAGMAAETLSCVIFVPVDVVKERLQIQSKGSAGAYDGTLNAVQTILKQEGVKGIYKGYAATLLSFGPFSACYFLIYEWLKRNVKSTGASSPTLFQSFACSALAGATASVVTNPLDLVKLRLQVQRRHAPVAGQEKYNGVLHGLSLVLKNEGWRGMLRGAGARVVFHVPNTAITFAVYEKCKAFLQERYHS